MAENKYELLYFKYPGRADISRLMLEAVGADHKNVYLTNELWEELKPQQRYGRVPRLTVTTPDGKVQHIWESRAIQSYIAEAFGLVPTGSDSASTLARAEVVSTVFSLYDAQDRLGVLPHTPLLEDRKELYDIYLNLRLPELLSAHEGLVAGPYYYGDKVTFPDLVLYNLSVRFNEIFGEGALINESKTPKLWKIVQALDAGPAGAYVRERRDFGTHKWDSENFEMVYTR